jgi:hypothetical protein
MFYFHENESINCSIWCNILEIIFAKICFLLFFNLLNLLIPFLNKLKTCLINSLLMKKESRKLMLFVQQINHNFLHNVVSINIFENL